MARKVSSASDTGSDTTVRFTLIRFARGLLRANFGIICFRLVHTLAGVALRCSPANYSCHLQDAGAPYGGQRRHVVSGRTPVRWRFVRGCSRMRQVQGERLWLAPPPEIKTPSDSRPVCPNVAKKTPCVPTSLQDGNHYPTNDQHQPLRSWLISKGAFGTTVAILPTQRRARHPARRE